VPLQTIPDPTFVAAIKAKVSRLLCQPNPTLVEINRARSQAVNEYVEENILGKPSSTLNSVSDRAIALVAKCFPNERGAAASWGRSYFEAIQGLRLIATVDESTNTLQYGYEGLNSYLYMRDDNPVALGGLYTEPIPEVGNALWGARIAIAPEYRNSTIFGKMLAHLSASAIRTVEDSRIFEESGAATLSPFFAVFTTRADWNSKVIKIYESLGLQDTGHDIEYNGLTEMVMAVPNILDPSVRSRIDRLVARFG
jgi:GNAT superfamily N-acetyltransferase